MAALRSAADGPAVVFIGLGHWHVSMHLAAARRAGLPVLGGWDPDEAAAGRLGLERFDTLDAALQSGARLAVVTGTPLEMPQRLLQAAGAGISCLVEKPVAPTGTALRPLAEEIRRMGAFVAVALPHQAGPLASQTVGSVRHLSFRLVNGRPSRYRDWGVPWVLDPAVGGGGALRNLGIHGVALARRLLGPDITLALSTLARWHGEAVEDHAIVQLAAPDGGTAVIEAGYLHPDDRGSDFEARLLGHDALAIDTGQSLLRFDANGAATTTVTAQSARYDDLMADVASRVRDGRAPAADLDDLMGAMDLIDTAYRLARTP